MGRPERKRLAGPLGALLRGLLAGAGGTAVMTAYQRLVQSGEERGSGGEPQSDAER